MKVSEFEDIVHDYERKWGVIPLRAILNRQDFLELKMEFMHKGEWVSGPAMQRRRRTDANGHRYHMIVNGIDIDVRDVAVGSINML